MKKQFMAATMAALMAATLGACGSSTTPAATTAAETKAETTEAAADTAAATEAAAEAGKEYKVGIVQFMDHPSLNQIEENVEKELDKISEEKGVNFNYKDYTFNGQGDATVLNQIASQLISDDVDIIIPIATPQWKARISRWYSPPYRIRYLRSWSRPWMRRAPTLPEPRMR